MTEIQVDHCSYSTMTPVTLSSPKWQLLVEANPIRVHVHLQLLGSTLGSMIHKYLLGYRKLHLEGKQKELTTVILMPQVQVKTIAFRFSADIALHCGTSAESLIALETRLKRRLV